MVKLKSLRPFLLQIMKQAAASYSENGIMGPASHSVWDRCLQINNSFYLFHCLMKPREIVSKVNLGIMGWASYQSVSLMLEKFVYVVHAHLRGQSVISAQHQCS